MLDHRSLPLRGHAAQGRFGATGGQPGVTLALLHPVSIVQVLARVGAAKSVKTALAGLSGVRVMNAGPDQYYVQAEGMAEGALAALLKEKLAAKASVVDQSHGRVVILLSGPKARAVLAKGTPVDVAASAFAVGQSAQTQMAHVGIHLTRVGDDGFMLSVFRGFSESLWEWLCTSAAEFGYQVD